MDVRLVQPILWESRLVKQDVPLRRLPAYAPVDLAPARCCIHTEIANSRREGELLWVSSTTLCIHNSNRVGQLRKELPELHELHTKQPHIIHEWSPNIPIPALPEPSARPKCNADIPHACHPFQDYSTSGLRGMVAQNELAFPTGKVILERAPQDHSRSDCFRFSQIQPGRADPDGVPENGSLAVFLIYILPENVTSWWE